MELEEFTEMLKKVCEDYDKTGCRYPESEWEGKAIFDHFENDFDKSIFKKEDKKESKNG